MLARAFESAGLSTVQISLLREHTEKLRPPRALFCDFPFGRALGKPSDPEFQHRVLAQALGLLTRPSGPVLEDFPEPIVPASAVPAPAAPPTDDPAFELSMLRGYYQQFVDRHGGRTAVGLAGVPATRLRGLVRLLQRYADGEEVDAPERRPDTPILQYLRYACDDLKAFYSEARLQQYPNAEGPAVEAWFWWETAAGALVRRVRDRMRDSGDPYAALIAFGVSRA